MENVNFTSNVSVTQVEQGLSFMSSILIGMSVVSIVIGLIMIISMYKLFKNSGEKGYKSIIPIYNMVTLMKIAGMQGWEVILLVVPLVNLFVMALLNVKLASKFNKSALFAIGLLFLPFIFYPILASVTSPKKEKVEKIKEDKKEDKVEEKVIEKTEDNDGIICPVCATVLAPDADTCFVCETKLDNKEINNEVETVEPIKTVEPIEVNVDTVEPVEPSMDIVEVNEVVEDTKPVEVVTESPTEFSTNLDEIPLDAFDDSMNTSRDIKIEDVLDLDPTKPVVIPEEVVEETIIEPVVPADVVEPEEVKDYTVNTEPVNEVNTVEEVKEDYIKIEDNFSIDPIIPTPVEVEVEENENVEMPIEVKTVTYDESVPAEVNELLGNDDIDLSVTKDFSAPKETKHKYVSSTKTLDEILRINSKIYEDQRRNQELINKKNKEMEEAKLLERMTNILAQVHEVTEVVEEKPAEVVEEIPTEVKITRVEDRVCKTCGSIVPEFSDSCLLCGTPYNN